MNQKAPLFNRSEVIEGNIQMYMLLVIIIMVWASIQAYQVIQKEVNPTKIETKKTPEGHLQGIYINN